MEASIGGSVKNSEDFVSNLSDSKVGNFILKIVRDKSLKSIKKLSSPVESILTLPDPHAEKDGDFPPSGLRTQRDSAAQKRRCKPFEKERENGELRKDRTTV